MATGVTIAPPAAEVPPVAPIPGLVTAPPSTTPRMNQVSITVPSNAAITLDTALVERMMEFIVQPCDRCERSSKQLATTLSGVLPQLLSVSFFPPFLFRFLLFPVSPMFLLLQIAADILLVHDYCTVWTKQDA